ncbi:hypothetical protein SPKIRA_38150 (plasmid) [Sphingomonas paucimobilis]|uniref:hypothetical protein n=1 Tax=Sphingomonas paucimobilis TaxID=13689 RepID=UPI0015DC0FF1|nr:hypothetical protein [Sphingomonas paucimobilis]BCI72985.1 hypothetical protein SPKIRA_38150 [Sphingomonas paucimobilis]
MRGERVRASASAMRPACSVDAQRATASATLQQVQSDLAVSQNEVALFRALGGGWRTDAGTR